MAKKRTSPLYPILITGGLVLLIGRQVLRKGEAIKSLNVNVTKVDYNKKDKAFVVFVRIINPANSKITIKSIVGDILWNGTYGATMSYLKETEIGAGEERTIQIPVKPNLDWVNLITEVIRKGKDAFNGTFEIKGVVNAEGLVVPFTYKNTIKIF
jgi:LEA14-like dessication related protein